MTFVVLVGIIDLNVRPINENGKLFVLFKNKFSTRLALLEIIFLSLDSFILHSCSALLVSVMALVCTCRLNECFSLVNFSC